MITPARRCEGGGPEGLDGGGLFRFRGADSQVHHFNPPPGGGRVAEQALEALAEFRRQLPGVTELDVPRIGGLGQGLEPLFANRGLLGANLLLGVVDRLGADEDAGG